MKIQHRGLNDETNDATINSSEDPDSCVNGSGELHDIGDCELHVPPCKASDRGTTGQCVTYYVNGDNSDTSPGIKDADLTSCETSIDEESVGVVQCDNDSQRLLMPECHEATPDTHQLGDVSTNKGLDQCFTVSASEVQTDCTSNSLQDAFMQFLKRKQVS